MNPFVFNTPPSVVFRAGGSREIAQFLAPRFGARIFLLTDEGVLRAGLVEPALESLTAAGIGWAMFSRVVADPPETVVMEAVEQAKAFGATGVVGLGGGSSLDVAKLVALVAASGEALTAIYGVGLARGPRLPLLLAPTTAGTGSEVTPIAIVTTGAHEKKGVVSPAILPDIALLDPDLTLGLPPAVTAATGVDAMVHAIEAFTSASANNNPVSAVLAKEALRLIGGAIEAAVRDGTDRAARGDMLLGAMLAGQAFANSPVAAVHALAYPIGGHFHVPHGLSNALVLPHVMRFNLKAATMAYAELAPHAFPALAGLAAPERAAAFIDALADLCRRLGLPRGLAAVGVGPDDLPMLADDAMKQTRLLVNNPRPLTQADALAIYRAAL